MNRELPDEPRHWLEGLRYPACRTLNASWLFYRRGDGPTVTCQECGHTVLVVVDDPPDAGGSDARGVA